MKKNRAPSKAVTAASKMPPLNHWPDRPETFDITKSQVLKWLLSQPQILEANFEYYKNRGAILFNPDTQLWHGRDFQE